ncbi:MAG: hypothetical protein JWP49_140 [Phenylobacterium sp.]|nr:hypothetical protein [Phenylobacterium sp.]
MGVNLFTFVGLYGNGLTTLDHILTKGAELAKSKGVSEADMLEWRLVDDMNPLRFQARTVINFARSWPARAAGLEVPADIAADLDLAGLKAAIAEAKALLATLKPAQFDGRDDVAHTQNLGGLEPTLPMGQWLSSFATTNFYFHLSMVYAILRHHGAEIGKRDLFAGGL